MRTKVINSADVNAYASALAEAAAALRDGALVVFPTETVYGIGASAASAAAVARLRDAKGRRQREPFTVHIGQPQHARQYLTRPSPLVRRLARRGWPGPLTLICEEPEPAATAIAERIPPAQLAEIYHDGCVGLRCPDHAAAGRLLGDERVPVVASSANRAGESPPIDLESALKAFDGQIEYAIDGGPTRHSTASTIVEVRGNTWVIRRAGAIDERMLRRWARSEVLFVCTGNSCRSPMAEYLFRRALAEQLGVSPDELADLGYHVSSAGTVGAPGAPASEGARQEMQRRGLDLSAHRAQPLTLERVHQSDRIYVLSPEHERAVLDLAPGAAGRVTLLDARGPVADPMGGSPEAYRQAADQIERAVQARLEEYLHEDRDW